MLYQLLDLDIPAPPSLTADILVAQQSYLDVDGNWLPDCPALPSMSGLIAASDALSDSETALRLQLLECEITSRQEVEGSESSHFDFEVARFLRVGQQILMKEQCSTASSQGSLTLDSWSTISAQFVERTQGFGGLVSAFVTNNQPSTRSDP